MKHLVTTVSLLWVVLVVAANANDTLILHNWHPRAIGPAGMSGRVTAIEVPLLTPNVIYAGTASGGLWRSTSGGHNWEPIMDDQPVASIGAVKVFQKNPSIIYVGTGEGNPRNSHNAGNGMYKSIDGGRTWERIGLEMSRNIHRIIIDPDNSDIVVVAALGSAWGDSEERGVFKTTDGGKTWRKVLYVNEKTGAAELVVDPSNPKKMFVSMWEHRREPWIFTSGGKGSGIYYTYNGGETWKQLTSKDGLPEGELGRAGLAIASSRPNIVYALVEANKNVLLRSDDGGHTWKTVADDNIGNRPFYYAEIYVDPHNENRLYNLFSLVTVSEDGGKTFETLLPYYRVHPDHHAWWIHPNDPDFLIDGNDGGLAISRDRGKTWRHIGNLPLGQYYHINVDDEFPYNLYGGMQDNGSWRGPSSVLRAGGIRNSYWEEVSFGDGFDVVPDRSDSRYCFSMWQGGNLLRIDLETGLSTYIRPASPDTTVELRFNWNAAIAADPFNEKGLYFGSQFLHKSADRGNSWTTISPDLTTNDSTKQQQDKSGGLTPDVTAAENFTTIIAIAPSALQEGVIWVGTDDGNVQVTTDGGQSWRNCIGAIAGVPKGTWVPQIQASPFNAGEAVVVFDNRRRNDWTPYIYRTKDFGKTWQRIAGDKDMYGSVQCFVFDPEEPNLMFVGTEFGLYYTLDGAASWRKWTHKFPSVPVADMVIQPRFHDLVIATFGRAAYILDDIRPLRAVAKERGKLPSSRLSLLASGDGIHVETKQAAGIRFAAETEFYGENRNWHATATVFIKPDTTKDSSAFRYGSPDSLEVVISDDKGEAIRRYVTTVKAGINRIEWRGERDGVRYPWAEKPESKNAVLPSGRDVLPGNYTMTLRYQGDSASTTVAYLLDPRLEISQEQLRSRDAFLAEIETYIADATALTDSLRLAQKSLGTLLAVLKNAGGSDFDSLRTKISAVQDTLKVIMELIIAPPGKKGGIVRTDNVLASRLSGAMWRASSWEAPVQTSHLLKEEAQRSLLNVRRRVQNFFDTTWKEFSREVQSLSIPLILPH